LDLIAVREGTVAFGGLFSAMTESYRENDRHYSFSLTWKHDNSAVLVLYDTNPDLSRRFTDASTPEKTVCFLA
jgi:hypothetical protein